MNSRLGRRREKVGDLLNSRRDRWRFDYWSPKTCDRSSYILIFINV